MTAVGLKSLLVIGDSLLGKEGKAEGCTGEIPRTDRDRTF